MKSQNEKIGTRELTSIIILVITLKSQDFNTINLFQTGLTATWIYPIIWFIIFITMFTVLSNILSKFNDIGLFEINQLLLGKFIGSLFNILFAFALFMTVLYSSKYYVNYLNLRIFPKTPMLILYALILFTAYYIAKGGFESIGRIAWLFIPLYILANSFLVFLVLRESFISDALFPILGNGLKDTLWNATKSSYLLGEFIVLGYVVPSLKDYRSYKVSNFVGFSISCVLILLNLLSYLTVFDYLAPQKVLNIYNELILSSTFLIQFNVIYLSIWISTAIIRFSFYLFCIAFIIGKLIKLKDYKKLLLPITVIVSIIGLIPQDPYLNIKISSIIIGNYLWPVFILLPILLWVATKLRGDKSENN